MKFFSQVYAQTLTLPDGSSIVGPVAWADKLSNIINRFLPILFGIVGIGLVLMIINAGFNFLTSAGDPKKMGMAQQRLTYAIVGFLIIFTAFWLTQLIGRIFGITEFDTIF